MFHSSSKLNVLGCAIIITLFIISTATPVFANDILSNAGSDVIGYFFNTLYPKYIIGFTVPEGESYIIQSVTSTFSGNFCVAATLVEQNGSIPGVEIGNLGQTTVATGDSITRIPVTFTGSVLVQGGQSYYIVFSICDGGQGIIGANLTSPKGTFIYTHSRLQQHSGTWATPPHHYYIIIDASRSAAMADVPLTTPADNITEVEVASSTNETNTSGDTVADNVTQDNSAEAVGIGIATIDGGIIPQTLVLPEGIVDNLVVSVNFAKIDDDGASCERLAPGDDDVFHNEISFTITSPSGTTVTLVANDDEEMPTYTSIDPYMGLSTIVFSDAAVTRVGGTVPRSGTFKPIQELAILNGQNAGGVWTLEAGDNSRGDPLCLFAWQLGFNIDGETVFWDGSINTIPVPVEEDDDSDYIPIAGRINDNDETPVVLYSIDYGEDEFGLEVYNASGELLLFVTSDEVGDIWECPSSNTLIIHDPATGISLSRLPETPNPEGDTVCPYQLNAPTGEANKWYIIIFDSPFADTLYTSYEAFQQ